jgi:hypothetical protein
VHTKHEALGALGCVSLCLGHAHGNAQQQLKVPDLQVAGPVAGHNRRLQAWQTRDNTTASVAGMQQPNNNSCSINSSNRSDSSNRSSNSSRNEQRQRQQQAALNTRNSNGKWLKSRRPIHGNHALHLQEAKHRVARHVPPTPDAMVFRVLEPTVEGGATVLADLVRAELVAVDLPPDTLPFRVLREAVDRAPLALLLEVEVAPSPKSSGPSSC